MESIGNLTTKEKPDLDKLKLAYEIAELERKNQLSRGLSALDIVSKIAAVSTPFILFILGIMFNAQRNKEADEQANLGRVLNLIKSLSSTSSTERNLALNYAEYLATHKLYPPEMYQALATIINTDTSQVVMQQTQRVLNALQDNSSTNTAAQLADVAGQTNNRIFVQYEKGNGRASALADSSMAILNAKGYTVPGKEGILPERMPSKNQLRYFRKSEKQRADSIAALLNQSSISVVTTYIDGYEQEAAKRPYPFELWLK